ncbi:hypothetical protein LCGC14_2312940, partial [marine sediment metagenome]
THILPDFPGKLAKRMMGEFAIVLYATLTNPDPMGKQKALWQLRPGGKVWGAGIKMPAAVRDNIPASIEQDWAELWLYLTGQKKLAKKGIPPVIARSAGLNPVPAPTGVVSKAIEHQVDQADVKGKDSVPSPVKPIGVPK